MACWWKATLRRKVMFAENAAKDEVHRYGTSNCITHTHQLLKDKPASGTDPLMFSLFWRFNPRAPRVRDEEKPKNRHSETACCGLNWRLMSYPVTLGESVVGSWVFKEVLKSKSSHYCQLNPKKKKKPIALVRRMHLSTAVSLHRVKTT